MHLRSALVAFLFVLAPAMAQVNEPVDETVQAAPVLSVRTIGSGSALGWEVATDQTVEYSDIWRYTQSAGQPEWEKIAESTSWNHIDKTGVDPDLTWYVVIAHFDDGTSLASNPATASEYPYCYWLYLTVPPTLREECLMPPPWPVSLVTGAVDEPTEAG